MKEDKENTRPREKRPAASSAASAAASAASAASSALAALAIAPATVDGAKVDEKQADRLKDKKETLSKVVIRRLPPSLTKEQLEEHLQPLPEHDYFEFFANDSSLYPHMFSRAYINFKNQEDIVLFRDRFDGYVFIDHKGQEYPAIVEFAPFQKSAKKKSKKKDAKTGTIDEDPEYKKFLESYSADDEKLTSTPETLLEEIEARNKELIAKKTTPLLNFLKNKQRLREEKREERRRREIERKRQREEERRKWKEEERRKRKDAEKLKKLERGPEKERDKSKDEPKIKLLKKPEKGDEMESEKREKPKRLDKENLNEEKSSGQSSTSAKRSDGEAKEDKAKKSEDEGGKDYRERDKDFERDRDRERMQREREKMRRQEEERRRQRERMEKERVFRRKEEEVRKERDPLRDKVKKNESTDFIGNLEKTDKVTKEDKKEDAAKRDRIRNKDRPAMQLYQPGARSRSRLGPYDDGSAKAAEPAPDKKQECEIAGRKEEEE
ncbi:regulator of nonsense transcripts 3B [Tachyglossus aculeatus]|uniref:regulator of nonsense transcripts 3B n=1 Tax=Tachyglossus aculeatus TaxID=9261 RepID=UPI0018F57CE8|nr:regulator of nonsense transcripts 3B [Tachyglossus aculeatus]